MILQLGGLGNLIIGIAAAAAPGNFVNTENKEDVNFFDTENEEGVNFFDTENTEGKLDFIYQ
jgi:hypothetical protein